MAPSGKELPCYGTLGSQLLLKTLIFVCTYQMQSLPDEPQYQLIYLKILLLGVFLCHRVMSLQNKLARNFT